MLGPTRQKVMGSADICVKSTTAKKRCSVSAARLHAGPVNLGNPATKKCNPHCPKVYIFNKKYPFAEKTQKFFDTKSTENSSLGTGMPAFDAAHCAESFAHLKIENPKIFRLRRCFGIDPLPVYY